MTSFFFAGLVLTIITGMWCADTLLATTAAPHYLRSERLSLPLNRLTARTSLPLDPTRQYELEIISNYTLRPLLSSTAVCQTTKVLVFQTTNCWLPVYFNGVFLPTVVPSRASRDLGAYIIDPQTDAYYVPKLKLLLWGNGKPLFVAAAHDFSGIIREAELVITDPIYREEQAQLARQAQAREQEEAREALARVQRFREHQAAAEARQARFMRRQEQIQETLEHQRVQMATLQPPSVRTLTPAHGIIMIPIFLFSIFLLSRLAAPHRRVYRDEKIRVAQHQARVRGREQEAQAYEEKVQQEAREREEAAQREAEKVRQEEEQKAEVAALFRKIDAECEQRQYELALRLDEFGHYADPAFLHKAAAAYQQGLMDDRNTIMQEHAAFHRDQNFIAYLKNYRPDLYERAIWKMKALALAEQLAVEPHAPPQRPRPTFEEVRARSVRYMQAQNEDLIAETVAIGEDIEKSCSALDHLNLDPDVKEQLVQDLVDRIVNKESANGNTHKKVV